MFPPRLSRHFIHGQGKPDLVYGTLDMLILKALQHDPRHGLAIADRIQQMSKDILRVEQGSLPALYRLGQLGMLMHGPPPYLGRVGLGVEAEADLTADPGT